MLTNAPTIVTHLRKKITSFTHLQNYSPESVSYITVMPTRSCERMYKTIYIVTAVINHKKTQHIIRKSVNDVTNKKNCIIPGQLKAIIFVSYYFA